MNNKKNKIRKCVSFIGTDIAGCITAGNCEFIWDENEGKIKCIDDITCIQDMIRYKHNLRHVAVISIINFEEDK